MESDFILQKGMMLIAMPTLLDPNFRQTVVLLCEHGPEGAMGLVVNRPTTVPLSTVVPSVVKLARSEDPVYVGGPVQTNAMMILYEGEPIGNSHPVMSDLHLTGDLEDLEKLDRGLGRDLRIKFYLGYAGWSAGQLEMEIRAGGWKLVPGDPGVVFQEDPVRVWPKLIQSLGEPWTVYRDMPPDPRLN